MSSTLRQHPFVAADFAMSRHFLRSILLLFRLMSIVASGNHASPKRNNSASRKRLSLIVCVKNLRPPLEQHLRLCRVNARNFAGCSGFDKNMSSLPPQFKHHMTHATNLGCRRIELKQHSHIILAGRGS